MRFEPTKLPGAWRIELEPTADERGWFARAWCGREAAAHGLETQIVQCNLSFNRLRGTLRGLHLQRPPHEEAKTVRCVQGAIYDVLVDLRPDSPTYRQWCGFELTAERGPTLYIPRGVAHGFQTLTDDAQVYYQMFEWHHPESASGVRWNDPAFGVEWPLAVTSMSERDRNYPDVPLGRLG